MNPNTAPHLALMILAALLLVGSASATVVIDMDPEETRIALQEGDSGGETLVVTVSEIRLDGVEIDGQRWAVVRVPGAHNLMLRGEPSLPFLTTEYLLGRSGGIDLELIDATVREINLEVHDLAGVAPSKGHFGRDVDFDSVAWSFDAKTYGSSEPYPSVDAWLDDPFIAGPVRAQASRIPVVRWRPADNALLVLEEMRFRIVPDPKAPNPRLRSDPPMTGVFSQLTRRMVNVGPETELDNRFVEVGRMLVIADVDFLDEIQPLVDWHTMVGYPTELVPTSVTGTSAAAIKSYIQAVYDEPESLTWIILVGDSQQIPTLTGVNSQHSPCDPCYTKLEGNDNRPDAAISRISAQNGAQVTAQVAKILAYERQPDQGSAGTWYAAGMGVASNDIGGSPSYHDWERMDWLRDDLLDPAYTYTEFDQIYDPGASAGEVTTAIEEGRGLGLYIGHGWSQGWVTTGFDTGDAGSLTNGEMLPVIWDVACVNGAFHSNNECFAESWLRREGGGAVSFEAATTNESWVPPCDAQRGFVDAIRLETDFTTGAQHLAGKHVCMDINGDGGGDQGNRFMEQSHLFGSAVLWPRTMVASPIDEPVDFVVAGGVASLTVTVDGEPLAKEGGAIVNFFRQEGDVVVSLGAGLTDENGLAQAAVDADPTHCHIHGHNLVPQSFELAAQDDGRVSLDGSVYACSSVVGIRVADANVPGATPAVADTVTVRLTNGTDVVDVLLTETDLESGFYAGSSELGVDLSVGHGDLVTVTYTDEDTGEGVEDKTAQASVDCVGPQISGVVATADHESVTVEFTTDEPGTTVVRWGLSQPPEQVLVNEALIAGPHQVTIPDLDACQEIFFEVESADGLGNLSVDDNGGAYHAVSTEGWTVYFEQTLDEDPGWEIENGSFTSATGWDFGQPTGLGQDNYGGPDPESGHTGDNVYGVNLNGDAPANADHNELTLTTPAFDLSEAGAVQLSYWRWLGVEGDTYDNARILISLDGGPWQVLWENDDETIDESSWSQRVLDITDVAAGSADVRIRWAYGESDGYWQYCGWNIDDIRVEGPTECAGNVADIFHDGFEGANTAPWSATALNIADDFNQLLATRGIVGAYLNCIYNPISGDYSYLGEIFNEVDGGVSGNPIVTLDDLYWKNELIGSTVAPYSGEDPDGDGASNDIDGDAFNATVQ